MIESAQTSMKIVLLTLALSQREKILYYEQIR